MKKLILSVAALLAFGFANAQDTEAAGTGTKGFANGDVFITGAFGFGSQSTGDEKYSTFEIAPSAGLFVTDNIAIGAKFGYQSTKAENVEGDETQDFSTVSVGAFGRYYTTPTSDFSFFGQLGFNYNSFDNNLSDSKGNGFDFELAPGVSYFISDNFALEATFGVIGYDTFEFDGAADSTDGFRIGLDMRDINLGLVYKF